MQITRDETTPVRWFGEQADDRGRLWVTSAWALPTAGPEYVGKLLVAELAKKHRWLKDPKQVDPLPEKVKLVATVFTYARQIGAGAFAYCCELQEKLRGHPRLDRVSVSYAYGYPTDKQRNGAMVDARAAGFDFLLMIDDDQVPDIGRASDRNDFVPFLPSALEFAIAHDGPCVVGAPYCGGPPLQEVMVMKHRQYVPDQVGGMGWKLDKFTRDEAAVERGIGRVAALPTGMLMIDLRVMDIVPPPWFAYEFTDPPFNTNLASTEDVMFTRNADWLGVPQYCHWSAWAGHDKEYTTGFPMASPLTTVSDSVYKAYAGGWRPNKTR